MNLDSTYAEVHFLLGKCLEQVSQYGNAERQFELARDYDVIRFRAPSSFNRFLKQIADSDKIPLINIEKAFNENSPDGIVGDNLILEHIHPNNIGYFLMAKTIAKGIADAHLVGQSWDYSHQEPDSVYIAIGRLSPLSYAVVNAGMRQLTSHWPFTLREEKREYPRVGDELTERLAKEFVSRGGGNLIQLHLNLGKQYLAQKEFNKALTEFEAALAIEPDCKAYNQIGLFYAQRAELAVNDRDTRSALGYYQKARSYFTDGLKFCPEDVNLNYNLGLLYTLTKTEREKASEVFEKVLKINPNHKDALQQLIRLHLINKDFEEAEIYLKKGIDLHPKETDFYLNLAMINLNKRKYDQAEKLLNKILEMKPGYQEAQNLLKEVHLQKSSDK
jgi:tetratricopeptide (TPR) repeat protein